MPARLLDCILDWLEIWLVHENFSHADELKADEGEAHINWQGLANRDFMDADVLRAFMTRHSPLDLAICARIGSHGDTEIWLRIAGGSAGYSSWS